MLSKHRNPSVTFTVRLMVLLCPHHSNDDSPLSTPTPVIIGGGLVQSFPPARFDYPTLSCPLPHIARAMNSPS